MFRNGSNCCNHPKSSAFCNVLQLYKRVLKRPVSVYTDQNGARSVAAHHAQPFNSHGGNPAGIRRQGDHGNVVLRHRYGTEIQSVIGQINGNGIPIQRPGNKTRYLLRSTCRTKHHFKHAHRTSSPTPGNTPSRSRTQSEYTACGNTLHFGAKGSGLFAPTWCRLT